MSDVNIITREEIQAEIEEINRTVRELASRMRADRQLLEGLVSERRRLQRHLSYLLERGGSVE